MQFLGSRDLNCRCGTSTQFHQRVAVVRTRELQGREVHAKESHKDNSLSEKAAKKNHEAGNCELHETKFKQLKNANMRFKKHDGELYKRSPTIGNDNSR